MPFETRWITFGSLFCLTTNSGTDSQIVSKKNFDINLHNGATTGNRQFLIFINYTTKYSPPTQSRRLSHNQRDWFVEANAIPSTVIWQQGKASFKWKQIVNIRCGKVQKFEQSLNSREAFPSPSYDIWMISAITSVTFPFSVFSHLQSTDDAKKVFRTTRERLRKVSLEIRLHVLT